MKTRNLLAIFGIFISMNLFAQATQHVVKQGETVYAIARKYGVSPTEVLRLNPSLGNGDKIHPGQTIKLPNGTTGSAAQTTAPAKTTPAKTAPAKTTPAKTTPAQTAPEKTTASTQTPPAKTAPTQNANEQPSYIINVPKKKETKQSPAPYVGTSYKELYRIQKKDNLYRIALNYQVTVEELLAANPGLTEKTKLKKGEFLYIPFSRADRQAEANRIAAEKAAEEAANAAKMKSHAKHLSVAVILPLKDGGDKGAKMLEFYRGLLMAADSVKQQGTSVDVYAYHSGSTAADINFVLSKPELRSVDFIFGPLDAIQASPVNEFCSLNNIRLVMPFVTTNAYGQNNPLVYQASISAEIARKNAADKVGAQFSNHNFVIMNTGASDDRGSSFTSELRSQIAARGFTAKSVNMNAGEIGYMGVLNQFRDNLIISDASSLNATMALVNKIEAFKQAHPEYKISLLGYPEWPTYVGQLLSQFYAVDTYAYTTFYRNPSDQRVLNFEAKFRQNYKKDLVHTFPRYGMYGFDLGYYFMNGLSKLGDFFDEKQSTLKYNALQNSFNFDQQTSNGAHVNNQINLVHYKSNQRIEVIK